MNPSKFTAVRGLLLGLLLYAGAEAAVFGSGWYRRYLEPESHPGSVELLLAAQSRAAAGPAIAVIGNSMLAEGFSAKIADQQARGRLRFANLSLAGTSPRCWYYVLREFDPQADRYQAIVIQVESFADEDGEEPMADQPGDLRTVAALLRPSDAWDFAMSYKKPRLRFEALRGALFKGYVLKHDVQAFLEHPRERVDRVALYRPNQAGWVYDYNGRGESLAGLRADWERGTLDIPSSVPPDIQARLQRVLLRRAAPQTGDQAAYRRMWFGRIVDRYRGSQTTLVFARVPRGPAMNPAFDPPGAPSTIRELPRVRVLPPESFEHLERPEYFWDGLHMNAAGRERFSRELAEIMDRAVPHR